MKSNLIQLHNVTPEDFKNEILSGVQEKLDAFKKSLKSDNTEYLTRKDASAMLGVSLVTIHDWCNKGILKPYRIGNMVRFKRADIVETLESSRTP